MSLFGWLGGGRKPADRAVYGDVVGRDKTVVFASGDKDFLKDHPVERRFRAVRPEQVEDVGMMRAAGETRKGDWMETWTGTRFYPLDARPHEVYIIDIAHHLARINRYNGACRWEHYSVAEHSVKMSIWVFVKTGGDALLALEALMHDACEAYIGDMVRPLKRNMPEFVDAEQRLWADAIAPRYGLPVEMSPLIKECDNRILVDERAQVMAPSGNTWGIDHLDPLGVRLEGWRPAEAETRFLSQFNFLWEMLET